MPLGENERALHAYLLKATTSNDRQTLSDQSNIQENYNKLDHRHTITIAIEDDDDMSCCRKTDFEKEIAADNSEVVEEAVCKADEVPDGTKKEVELRGRKILIVNDGGNYMAVNGLCPHYNWPLVNGQYSKGKIRCALHGACFNMKTGDIEDYPTFDSIHPFQVKKVGNELVIKTTEKRLGADRRTRHSWIKQTTAERPIIVVGGGPAGQSIVENLRIAGCKTPIILFTKESMPAYDRVLLSKVIALDAAAHTVTLSDKSSYLYSKLVLALGGTVRKLTNKGSDLKGIHTLRIHSDPKDILADATGEDVVCVGASFIGMEAASTVTAAAKSVTVVCSTPEPLPVFGTDVGKAVRTYFESKGVKIITNARVERLEGKNGHVSEVVLQDGTRVPAHCVIAGIGIEPDTQWVKNHQIQLDKRGYIMVNEKFETNLKDVLAIGDVVSAPLPYWNIPSLNIQHFQVAQRHGQLAAWSMLGKPQPGKLIPFFWSLFFFERAISFAGSSEGYDEMFCRGEVEEMKYVKYYLKKGNVVAVSTSGGSPACVQFLALFDQGRVVTIKDVERNTTDDWAFLLK